MRTPRVVPMLLCAVTFACDQSGDGLVTPPSASLAIGAAPDLRPAAYAEEPTLVDASALLATGGTASGYAVNHGTPGTPVQDIRDQKYSFTAVSTGSFPQANGQVEVHTRRFSGVESRIHAEVTCLSVVGNQAWVGSRITRFVVDGQESPDFVGRPMIFRVEDVGDGQATSDIATFVFLPPVGGDLVHCNTRPPFPPVFGESSIANVQVKPE